MPHGNRWVKSVLSIFRSYVYHYGVFVMFPRNDRDLEELLKTNNQILLDIRDLFLEEVRQFRNTITGYFVTLFTVVIIWLFWFQK
jgi:hypothetical protein